MSRLKEAFSGEKAFVAFLTCGDPDLETTERLIQSIAEAGADVIELGIPFSDPTAEGPVIQAANLRALSNGVTTDDVFQMVRRVRKTVGVPLVFMTYANVVFSYGTERFLKAAADIGMDGLILPDVPFEEKGEFEPVCRRYGMDFISFVSPTSRDRVRQIAKEAEGFLYCVSSLGVTGVRSELSSGIGEITALVREVTDTPVAIGFGISTPLQAQKMAAISDGVIVGSAIVRIVGQYGREAASAAAEYVRQMKAAISRLS